MLIAGRLGELIAKDREERSFQMKHQIARQELREFRARRQQHERESADEYLLYAERHDQYLKLAKRMVADGLDVWDMPPRVAERFLRDMQRIDEHLSAIDGLDEIERGLVADVERTCP